jgi:hypothetical protein
MHEILGKAKTVRELLHGVKYTVDYYQREFKWHTKQIHELLDDLSGKFLEEYEDGIERGKVQEFPHYFLGSIIISHKNGTSYIVDGQQRLTSLTLLLILLRNLLLEEGYTDEPGELQQCIRSSPFGNLSFNLDVSERNNWMNAAYKNELTTFDPSDQPESVQNLHSRFTEMSEYLPSELTGSALPYFCDWLLYNVHLVEITAYSDEDAYTIFETMNDRGLSLSPTEMLKGYLLANLAEDRRTDANNFWKQQTGKLRDAGKELESDFFKAWFRSQYSQKIRPRKKNAKNEDFDRIGTEFHRWLRETSKSIGLANSSDFYSFIDRDFRFYCRHYLRCIKASEKLTAGLEPIYYNATLGFTLQYMVLLSPLKPGDSDEVVNRKLWLVGRYLDILLAWRIWNFRVISYANMQYAMFTAMKGIRGLGITELVDKLQKMLAEAPETFTKNSDYHDPDVGYALHQQNRHFIHCILARLTEFIEIQSGLHSQFEEYVRTEGKNRFEVEHIWANRPERHTDEFPHEADFRKHRNRIGGLLLLPKSFNASYGDLPYTEKLPHYRGQNLLAQSLHLETYSNNPGFNRFIANSGLPFEPHAEFKKRSMDCRCKLYLELAQKVWNPSSITA